MNEAAAKAALELGAGSGAVRTIAGSMSMHLELEQRFAAFKHAEAALMFQSGFTANAGTVAAILDKEDVIVSDQLNHASIIDGARLSRAEIKVFPHKDAEAAGALLAETARPGRRQLLITDGVFSMDGDIAPLPELVEVAEIHGAIMMIDDAHATGCSAPAARAPSITSACTGAWTSKWAPYRRPSASSGGSSLAHAPSSGGWRIADDRTCSRPALLPPSLPRCTTALDVIRDEPERLERLWSNTRAFKAALHELGFDTGVSESPITPVIAGDEDRAQALGRRLFEEGVFAPAIVFPTVVRGQARVRTIVTADHTELDLSEAVETFEKVGRELSLI